jgi:hypothetical protein
MARLAQMKQSIAKRAKVRRIFNLLNLRKEKEPEFIRLFFAIKQQYGGKSALATQSDQIT